MKPVWSIVLVLATLAGVVTLGGDFVYEDHLAIESNPIVRGEVPWRDVMSRDAWGHDIEKSHHGWRPLATSMWRALWSFNPGDPSGFRFVSLLLHLLCVIAAVRVATDLRPSPTFIAIAAGLFAVHPLNAAALGAVVGQADLAATWMFLFALLGALRANTAPECASTALAFAGACLFSESAMIMLPALFAAIVLRPKDTLLPWILLVALLGIGMALTLHQLSIAPGSAPGWEHAVAPSTTGMTRVAMSLSIAGRALSMGWLPFALAPSHGFAAFEPHVRALLPWAAVGVVLLVSTAYLLVTVVRQRRLIPMLGILLWAGPGVAQALSFGARNADLSEHLLYPSTFGVGLLVAYGLDLGCKPLFLRRLIGAAIVIAALVVSLPVRVAWQNDDALWARAVRVEPNVMLHHFQHANHAADRNQLAEAAFHRLIGMHLARTYPQRVDWLWIDTLDQIAPEERVTELPDVLYPDAPCPIIVDYLRQTETLAPGLYNYAFHRWQNRYPKCIRR